MVGGTGSGLLVYLRSVHQLSGKGQWHITLGAGFLARLGHLYLLAGRHAPTELPRAIAGEAV
jgi:hypothetical protein